MFYSLEDAIRIFAKKLNLQTTTIKDKFIDACADDEDFFEGKSLKDLMNYLKENL